MNSRTGEAIAYLYPDAARGQDYVVSDDGSGTGPVISHWSLPDPPPTDAEITAALAEKDGAADAEVMRVATFADDPEVADPLNATKGATAAEIDAYVESVVTLTATDIDALRLEVQTLLRAILRRQYKVLFNPAPLISQLDTAKKGQAEIMKARSKT